MITTSVVSRERRFPSPWSVKEDGSCFVVRDKNEKVVRHIYFKDARGRRTDVTLFTRDEARHMAVALAELPELWRRG